MQATLVAANAAACRSAPDLVKVCCSAQVLGGSRFPENGPRAWHISPNMSSRASVTLHNVPAVVTRECSSSLPRGPLTGPALHPHSHSHSLCPHAASLVHHVYLNVFTPAEVPGPSALTVGSPLSPSSSPSLPWCFPSHRSVFTTLL